MTARHAKARSPASLLPWIVMIAWILAILFGLMLLVGSAPSAPPSRFWLDGAFGGRALLLPDGDAVAAPTLIVGMAFSVMLSLPRRPVQHRRRGPTRRRRPSLGAGRDRRCRARRSCVLVVAILAGMMAGALWALLAGILHVYVGVPLLVGSLLLNFPIRYIASYLVAHPFRDVDIRHGAIASGPARGPGCLIFPACGSTSASSSSWPPASLRSSTATQPCMAIRPA